MYFSELLPAVNLSPADRKSFKALVRTLIETYARTRT